MQEIEGFKKLLKNKGKSELTIKSYSSDVKNFLNYVDQKSQKDIISSVYEYKTFLFNSGYVPESINRKLISIKQFLCYLGYEPNIKLEKIQSQNYLDDILTLSEITKMVEICDKERDIRAKALILTLYYTGTRISECLQIKISDITKDYITIRGKGDKYRKVFISQKLKTIWKEYAKYRTPKSNMLFTGQKGAINRTTAHTIIKKYGLLAGVDFNKCHCHSFRHVYCKRLVDKKISLDTVADLAGHQNISTTVLYTKRTKKELLDIINDM